MVETERAVDAETLRSNSREGGEPGWLVDLRCAALDAAADAPTPDRAMHLWRYTDPERLEAPAGTTARTAPWRRAGGDEAPELPAGVTLSSIEEAAISSPELIQPRLASLVGVEHGRQASQNLAWARGGIFLHVARDVVVRAPIHLITRVMGGSDSVAHPRILIVVERGAELSLVEEQAAGDEGGCSLVNCVTEIHVEDGARLSYALVQDHGARTVHSLVQRARLGQDANLDTITISIGGRLSKADVGTELAGPGAECEMLGVVFGDGRQHFDHHTVLDHVAPHTRSNLDFRVALSGRATSAYTGLLRIRENATRTNASQQNRNLLLSAGAHADSIPELEILTDDVSAAHGVTAGPIDENQVFYCQARGLDREQAMHTIVRGFFEPIIARVPADNVRTSLRRHVDRKLGAEEDETGGLDLDVEEASHA